jgi:hypothetical protein
MVTKVYHSVEEYDKANAYMKNSKSCSARIGYAMGLAHLIEDGFVKIEEYRAVMGEHKHFKEGDKMNVKFWNSLEGYLGAHPIENSGLGLSNRIVRCLRSSQREAFGELFSKYGYLIEVSGLSDLENEGVVYIEPQDIVYPPFVVGLLPELHRLRNKTAAKLREIDLAAKRSRKSKLQFD